MQDEIGRIRKVYIEYEHSRAVQTRRSVANAGNRRIVEERVQAASSLLYTHGLVPLGQRRVLDVGCGKGAVLASLMKFGAQPDTLYGVDVLADRIQAARRAYPQINFICANGEHLAFEDNQFDLLLLFTVFSSVLDDGMACNVAREVRRVLKPGGAVLWYDFRYNNPWNRHVRGMGKRKIRLLFPEFKFHLRTLTLFPPLARRLGPFTPVLYPLLATIPPLRTHYLGLLVKPIPDQ